jgi:hypothetical protein
MNSPGHRANILTDYRYTGIGVAEQGDAYYITQIFYDGDINQLESLGLVFYGDDFQIEEDTNSNPILGLISGLTTNQRAGIFIVLVAVFAYFGSRFKK